MEPDTASMRIKSYFAGSVEEAIQEARRELGQEAMLITSRRSPAESKHLGAYEVVFGVQGPAGTAAPTRSKPRANAAAKPAGNAATLDLSAELQNLRAQLQDIKSTLQLGGPRRQTDAPSEAEELSEELIALELTRPLAQDIVAEALRLREQRRQVATAADPALRELAVDVISQRLRFAPTSSLERQEGGRAVVFVGPTGAGKTTTLVKFAIQECLARRFSVRIVSLDPYRVAAQERLRAIAGIVGLSFTAANTAQEFLEALDESRSKDIVLVDTPGFGRGEQECAQDILACLEPIGRKETHLVLPATMKRADLLHSVRQYAAFRPDYLLFTKLDETESLGTILGTALEADQPLSFFTAGQSIPEDITGASAPALLGTLFRGGKVEAVTAA